MGNGGQQDNHLNNLERVGYGTLFPLVLIVADPTIILGVYRDLILDVDRLELHYP